MTRPWPRLSASLRGNIALVVAVVVVVLAIRPAAAPAQPTLVLQEIANGLASPLGLVSAKDGTNRLFIVLQGGRILIWNGTSVLPTAFLDIHTLVSCCGERGLLGLAFHPSYETNGLFFINYTDVAGNTVVARYRVSPTNPNLADPDSGQTVLTVAQPFPNHKGGQLQFGPDGFLYIGMGDGGDVGDPGNRAQDLDELLGKLLRIDIDTFPYAIPPGNPFVGKPGRDEIWGWGLRNPWRFTFDRDTGDLFIADVGQMMREEVNFEPAGSPGGRNYGWRRMEGTLCFNPMSGCDDGTLVRPILEYDHGQGCSITGGYRYRGSLYPSLFGYYLYGDFCSGLIWGATQGAGGAWSTSILLDTAFNVTSFGEDEAGTLYLVHRNDTNGRVFRITTPIPAPPGEIIVDNAAVGVSDASRTFTGTWCVSGAPGPLGPDSLFSCGTGTDTYRWIPAIPGAGSYDVYVRWTQHANRSRAVPIAVTHAGGTTSRTFNEQTGGAVWVLHGRYAFNAGAGGFVQVSGAGGQAAADAVRLVPAPGGPPPAEIVIDNAPAGVSDASRSFTGTWCLSEAAGQLGPDSLFGCGAGTDTYRWTPAIPTAGPYDVYVRWTQHPNRSRAVPIAVTHAGGTTSKTYNEQTGGGVWVLHGRYSFSAGAGGFVQVSDVGGQAAADAVRFVPATVGPGPTEIVIDNASVGASDATRSFSGSWCLSEAAGQLGADSLFSCGSGTDSYRWTPSIPAPATYDVYVRWTQHANRSTTVPIAVTHAGGTTSKAYNEQTGGGVWVLHGRYAFNAGSSGFVQVTDASGQAAADAVRFVPVP